MKKRILTILIPIIVIVAAVLIWFFVLRSGASYVKDPSEAEVEAAFKLLNEAYLEEGESPEIYFTDYMADNGDKTGEGEHYATLMGGISSEKFYADNSGDDNVPANIVQYTNAMLSLKYQDVAQYKVSVEKEGLYYVYVDYIPVGSTLSDYTASIKVNGEQPYLEMNTILFPINWKDDKNYPVDGYGDEIAPLQDRIQEWRTIPLYNNTYVSTTPLCFYLNEGENLIELQNLSSAGLAVGQMTVKGAEDAVISYADYSAKHSGESLVNGEDSLIKINAISYKEKNSTQAIYGSSANASLTPFDIDNDKLNTLMWSDAGTEITYEFEVKKTGMYKLGFHYQNNKDEFSSFGTIKIDGEVPFAEMYDYEFKPVSSGWENLTLADKDGNPYQIYLKEGTHTISIKSEISPVMEAYRYALLIQKHVTDFQLEITKVTGADIDTDRAWKMTKYIPEIESYLNAYQTLITHIRFLLQDYSTDGNAGAILAYLDKAEVFIEEDLEYPDEIALHTEDLTGAENSILQSVSAFTTALLKDNFVLDMVYVYGDAELPDEDQSVFSSAWIGVKQLLNTFLSDKYSTDVDEDDEQTITIWMNKAVQYVDTLQKMADTEFTPKTGIKVKITTMPDVGKISLAVAAGETPDIALGLQSYVPFDLASRGAIYDMSNFEDFWNVAARFPSGSFVSYVYNEGVYAIPETTDFNAVVYRKDIFNSLGIEVPSTWNEMLEILPTLQRYGMNFYHNIGIANVSYKWFYQTTPMMLQNGGSLYTEDGTMTAIDSKEAVKGMQILGDLFTKYSLPTSVGQFFNSFRYSTLPIGIIGMEDYTLIKNGAPELEGQWAIAPYLGTEQADGTIDRTFIANGTGGIMFGTNKGEPTQRQENAWEFFKWWTSTEVQTEFAYTLRSTYGKTYFWLTANLDALQNVPVDEADKQVILEQVNYVTDVPRTPGQYLLERTISDIWNTVVFDGTSAQVAVDESVLEVNKEIKRKMQEFGFYDEEGNQIKDYVIRGKDWIQEQQDKAKAEGGVK